jgi:hypothetical protein
MGRVSPAGDESPAPLSSRGRLRRGSGTGSGGYGTPAFPPDSGPVALRKGWPGMTHPKGGRVDPSALKACERPPEAGLEHTDGGQKQCAVYPARYALFPNPCHRESTTPAPGVFVARNTATGLRICHGGTEGAEKRFSRLEGPRRGAINRHGHGVCGGHGDEGQGIPTPALQFQLRGHPGRGQAGGFRSQINPSVCSVSPWHLCSTSVQRCKQRSYDGVS